MTALIECLRWQADCARLGTGGSKPHVGPALSSLSRRLMRKRLAWTRATLTTAIGFAARAEHLRGPAALPTTSLITAATRLVETDGMTPHLRRALGRMLIALNDLKKSSLVRKQINRIDRLLGHRQMARSIVAGEPWADAALESLGRMDGSERRAWEQMIGHALRATTSQPSKAWLRICRKRMETIGLETFGDTVAEWLSRLGGPSVAPGAPNPDNSSILRGLIWGTGLLEADILHEAVRRTAERCFAPIPKQGPANPMVGNACLLALARAGAADQLRRLRSCTDYRSVQNRAEQALKELTQSA